MICLRLDSSPYFSKDYLPLEKQALQSELSTHIQAVHYDLSSLPDKTPWIAITNSQTDLSHISEDQLNYLKLIVHPNSGYDNFSPTFVQQCPCPIIIGHEIRAQAVAEVALASIFERFCPLPDQTSWSSTRAFPRQLLAQQKVQLIGHGHIGQLLERILSPLVDRVAVYDPFKDRFELELLTSSIVIVAASLNPSSHHFINRAFFEQLPTGFFLCNPARGLIVCQDDLITSLNLDPTAGAYLDVYEQEPAQLQDFEELRQRGQIKTTSHIAGVHSNLEPAMLKFLIQTLKAFFDLSEDQFDTSMKQRNLKYRLHANYLI